ncbi:hypothetical protein Vadar_016077 [Vaccinium darrowii]|uniref:Uncharacterized protein n=1 Tax=Vaccinium darrowii TaxID=229202 RepID=A0ACB7ZKH4_9ERIC|nr:hypothetical protein Vadar_016077 [Vaccinium darrowii]
MSPNLFSSRLSILSPLTSSHRLTTTTATPPFHTFYAKTKNRVSRLDAVKKSLNMDSVIRVDPVGTSGGLALFWKGYPFTWRNNRSGVEYVQERLDRVLVSPSWHRLYSQASVTHIESVGSDHNAIRLSLQTTPAHSRVPFRFDAHWVDDDEAEQDFNSGIPYEEQQKSHRQQTSSPVKPRSSLVFSRSFSVIRKSVIPQNRS